MKKVKLLTVRCALALLLATPTLAVEEKANIRETEVYQDSSNPGVPLLELPGDELDITAGAATHLSYSGLSNNIGSHGGVPDGTTDCRDALVAALDAAEDSDGELAVYIPAGRWAIKSDIYHNFEHDLTIFGEGTLVFDDSSNPGNIQLQLAAEFGKKLTWRDVQIEAATNDFEDGVLRIEHKADSKSTTLNSNDRAGDRVVVVADADSFAEGDLIWIESPSDSWPYDANGNRNPVVGELNRIQEINYATDTITLYAPLRFGYNGLSETINVKGQTPVRVELENLSIRFTSYDPNSDPGGDTDTMGLRGAYWAESRMDNCKSYGARHSGFKIDTAYNLAVTGGMVEEGDDPNLGYGFQFSGTRNVSVTGLNGHRCRRAVDWIESKSVDGYPCVGGQVVGGVIVGLDNQGSCHGTHDGACDISFVGVTCIHGKSGIISRSPFTKIQSCTFFDQVDEAIRIHGGPGFEITDNTMPGPGVDLSDLWRLDTNDVFVSITKTATTTAFDLDTSEQIIRGNSAMVLDSFIDFGSNISQVENLTVANNFVALQNVSASGENEFLNFQNSDVDLTGVKFRNNNVRYVRGDSTFIRASGTVDVGDTVYAADLNESITASSGGSDISEFAGFVTITSSNFQHAVVLPTPFVGRVVKGSVGANGCKFWTSGSGVKINGVDCSTSNEAEMLANSQWRAVCVSDEEWILSRTTSSGADGGAITPDAR